MYEETTQNIKITVKPYYLDSQSDPAEDRYIWAYHVVIENLGEESVKLINRYWRIIDEAGHIEEVHGAGVVGEQPSLKPGDVFEYASGTPLKTPSGIMGGHYEMKSDKGLFNAIVPSFSLDSPFSKSKMN
ncbi:MAG: Co2+/Mg2+ efflux protein ApaG [Pseudomonadota bacterium]